MPHYEPLDQDVDSLRLLILLPRIDPQPSTTKHKRRDFEDDFDAYESGSINSDSESDEDAVESSNDEESEDFEAYPSYKHAEEQLTATASLPGETIEEEMIHCRIENHTFRNKPQYEALSYTWGDEPARYTIQVNGQPLLVRENLYHALVRLRCAKPRQLWIDAICIDQANIRERNYQVSLMAFIFTRAQKVIAYLNISLLPRSGGGRSQIMREGWRGITNDARNRRMLAENVYWKRVWIIQELILAKNIHFLVDDFTLTQREIGHLASECFDTSFDKAIKLVLHHRDKDKSNRRLELLMEKFDYAQCSEPRDKIFGLLGLAYDNEIDVDYNLGYFELYRKLIEFHTSSEPVGGTKDEYLRPEIDRAARLMKFSELIQWQFCGAVQKDKQTMASGFYSVRGVLLDEIVYIGATIEKVMSSILEEKRFMKAVIRHHEEDTQEVQRTAKRYVQAVVTGDRQQTKGIRGLVTGSYGYKWDRANEDSPSQVRYVTGVVEPKLFIGKQGHVGALPPETRVGDLVCGFWQSNVRVILRPSSNDRWEIVGKADAMQAASLRLPAYLYTDAINLDIDELKSLSSREWNSYGRQKNFNNAINLRVDLNTLQMLTC